MIKIFDPFIEAPPRVDLNKDSLIYIIFKHKCEIYDLTSRNFYENIRKEKAFCLTTPHPFSKERLLALKGPGCYSVDAWTIKTKKAICRSTFHLVEVNKYGEENS